MIVSVLFLDIIFKNRGSRYNDEKKRIELDKTREYYEEKIYQIQSELLKNDRRWADANNLILAAQKDDRFINNTQDAQIAILKNFGIDNLYTDISVNKKSVFVLTPFIQREQETFDMIKTTCTDVNLSCTRGDEIYRDKDILSHIIISIAESSVIIANLNGRNPNVFYELGICHSLGKPVILISKTKNNLPFDIQNKNVVFYEDLNDLQVKLKNEFLKVFIDKN